MRRIAWFSMDVRKTLFALCLSRAGYRRRNIRPFTFPAKTVCRCLAYLFLPRFGPSVRERHACGPFEIPLTSSSEPARFFIRWNVSGTSTPTRRLRRWPYRPP